MLGYIINAPRSGPGNGFVVLANATDRLGGFSMDLPAGRWRVIGNGEKVDTNGLPGFEALQGPRAVTLQVQPMHSIILMDGF
jgi:hypothetical protein